MSDPARRHRRHADPAGDGLVLPPVPPGARALLVGASGPLAGPVGAALAHAGWGVAVVGGSDAEAGQAVVAALPGPGHVVLRVDPADSNAVSEMVDSLERAGGIDLLVDVSGAAASLPPLGQRLSDWTDALTAVLTVDVLGPAAVAHAVADAISRSGRPGTIVIVVGSGPVSESVSASAGGSAGGSALAATVSAGRQGLAGGLATDLRGTPVAVSTVVTGGAGADQVIGAVLSLIRGASASLTLR